MSKMDDAFPKSQHELHNLRIIELLEKNNAVLEKNNTLLAAINSKLDTFGQVMLKQIESKAKVKK